MVLVIEADPEMAGVLSELVRGIGHSVMIAHSADAALRLAVTAQLDLILLDLVLPDRDGLVLLTRLRDLTPSPIIAFGARSDQVHRVIALKVGADDFVAKPFDLDELEARITAVLRRSRSRDAADACATGELRVGALIVAPSRGTARISDRSLQLTPTEYRLLVQLASQPEHVLSRRALAEAVWGYVDVHIGRLRKKMRAAGGEHMIVTVHGTGFSLSERSGEPRPAPDGALLA
jgi:DNA-binding response OmpR family regulator